MPDKIKYMKCPDPAMGCAECGHRGKHKQISLCSTPCGKLNGCVPYDPTMVPAVAIDKSNVLTIIFQCPNCKTIKGGRTLNSPKCPECGK